VWIYREEPDDPWVRIEPTSWEDDDNINLIINPAVRRRKMLKVKSWNLVPVMSKEISCKLESKLRESLANAIRHSEVDPIGFKPDFLGFFGLEVNNHITAAGAFFLICDVIVTARHLVDFQDMVLYGSLQEAVIYTQVDERGRPSNTRRINLEELTRVDVSPFRADDPVYKDINHYYLDWVNSGFDIVGFHAPKDFGARYNIKSATLADLGYDAEGRVHVFGNPHATISASSGPLYYDINRDTNYGTVLHGADTINCFSGSPLVTKPPTGRPKILGMHVAGKEDEGKGNVAIGSHAIYRLLQKAGKTPRNVPWDTDYHVMKIFDQKFVEPALTTLESKEKKRQQGIRFAYADDPKTNWRRAADRAAEEFENVVYGEDNELLVELEKDEERERTGKRQRFSKEAKEIGFGPKAEDVARQAEKVKTVAASSLALGGASSSSTWKPTDSFIAPEISWRKKKKNISLKERIALGKMKTKVVTELNQRAALAATVTGAPASKELSKRVLLRARNIAEEAIAKVLEGEWEVAWDLEEKIREEALAQAVAEDAATVAATAAQSTVIEAIFETPGVAFVPEEGWESLLEAAESSRKFDKEHFASHSKLYRVFAKTIFEIINGKLVEVGLDPVPFTSLDYTQEALFASLEQDPEMRFLLDATFKAYAEGFANEAKKVSFAEPDLGKALESSRREAAVDASYSSAPQRATNNPLGAVLGYAHRQRRSCILESVQGGRRGRQPWRSPSDDEEEGYDPWARPLDNSPDPDIWWAEQHVGGIRRVRTPSPPPPPSPPRPVDPDYVYDGPPLPPRADTPRGFEEYREALAANMPAPGAGLAAVPAVPFPVYVPPLTREWVEFPQEVNGYNRNTHEFQMDYMLVLNVNLINAFHTGWEFEILSLPRLLRRHIDERVSSYDQYLDAYEHYEGSGTYYGLDARVVPVDVDSDSDYVYETDFEGTSVGPETETPSEADLDDPEYLPANWSTLLSTLQGGIKTPEADRPPPPPVPKPIQTPVEYCESPLPFYNRRQRRTICSEVKSMYKRNLTLDEVRQPLRSYSDIAEAHGVPFRRFSDTKIAQLFNAVRRDPRAVEGFDGADLDQLLSHPSFSLMREYSDSGEIEYRTLKEKGNSPNHVICNKEGEPIFALTGFSKRGYDKTNTEPRSMSEDSLSVLREVLDSDDARKLGLEPNHFDREKTADFPFVSQYVWPPDGVDGCIDSLKSQALEMTVTTDMSLVESGEDIGTCPVAAKLVEIYEEYPAVEPPLLVSSSDETPLRADFSDKACQDYNDFLDQIYNSFDGERSAGWSSCYIKGVKKVWLQDPNKRLILSELATCRHILRYVASPVMGFMRPMEMVAFGLKDPAILFTKKEAHSATKALEKTWRQIWACSLLDSVVQLMTHFGQNKADIAAFAEGSLKSQAIGMGHHDEGISHFGKLLDWLGSTGKVRDRDARGWDLSVPRDGIVLDAERRMYNLALSPEDEHLRPMMNRLLFAQAMASSAHVACIGGNLYECMKFGVTASGDVSTSAQNSPIRQAQVRLADALRAISLGDDLLFTGAIRQALLDSFGVRTKVLADEQDKPPEGPHDFTSHRWRKINGVWEAEFLNLPKMIAHADFRAKIDKATGLKVLDRDAVAGMLFALRHSPEQTRIFTRYTQRMGWWTPDIVPEDLGCGEFF